MPVRDCGSIQKDKTPHFWGPKMNRIDHNNNNSNNNNSNNNNNNNRFRVFFLKRSNNSVNSYGVYSTSRDSAVSRSITCVLNSPPHIVLPHATCEPSDRIAANASAVP